WPHSILSAFVGTSLARFMTEPPCEGTLRPGARPFHALLPKRTERPSVRPRRNHAVTTRSTRGANYARCMSAPTQSGLRDWRDHAATPHPCRKDTARPRPAIVGGG